MHFHKFQYPANFEFTAVTPNKSFTTRRGPYRFHVAATDADIYHFQVTGKGWARSDSMLPLSLPGKRQALESSHTRLVFAKDGGFALETKEGAPLLAAAPGRLFGQCGEASLFEFIRSAKDQFYGMGEKWTGLEHSNKITKFWNTDIWADFHRESFINGTPPPDPAYVSVPYLILKRGNTYIGLLLDNPHVTFISTRQGISIAGQMEAADAPPAERLVIGAEQGQPNLYLLYGPTLAELTRKLQSLVGCTPLPPAWALGYHQCRWGYRSAADLNNLDAQFRKHDIPVDGLWLDIDYMRGYRVFTYEKTHFPNPRKAIAKLTKAGRKVVPIIDPGIKLEPGYDVYERGRRAAAYCLNPQGKEFVGLVWPGETVFPDFSTESGRAWWAGEVEAFARTGLYGAWLDMNDPATGPAENEIMLFDHGRKSHSTFHNQYALGMAAATREGFLTARPDSRPFLLSRSGFTGSSRYTAIWTGDNYSNYHHLKNSIATTLNLALSGIPFNAPDAGGFGGDTTPELISDWYKAGFLFPVFRNHSIRNSRQQEPWAFDKKTLALLRRYIQLRYRLRPYLYQLFARQEEAGEAILRPLFYDFQDTDRLPLGLVDDQFMVGPCIMQAPFVVEKQKSRPVILPGGTKWYDVSAARWIGGGRKITVRAEAAGTPIYIRDGSILPLARLAPGDSAFHGARVDFHVFLSGNGTACTRYRFDDGESFAYRTGARSEVEVIAKRSKAELTVQINAIANGFGSGDFTLTAPAEIRRVTLNGQPARRTTPQGVPFGPGKTVTWRIS
jgi:alpha-glucosidase